MRRIFNSRCVLSTLLYVIWGGTSMSFPTLKAAGTSSRTKTLALSAVGVAVLAAVGYGWWAWATQQTTVADKDANEAVAQPSAGSVQLNAAQLRAQGVETAIVKDAAAIPLDGLPAQTVAPLSASAQVVAPYGGVVTRVLVDEGAAVRQGQALARIQSKDVLAAQADLARARTDATAAATQARRDAALLAEGIIPAARNEQTQARAAAATHRPWWTLKVSPREGVRHGRWMGNTTEFRTVLRGERDGRLAISNHRWSSYTGDAATLEALKSGAVDWTGLGDREPWKPSAELRQKIRQSKAGGCL